MIDLIRHTTKMTKRASFEKFLADLKLQGKSSKREIKQLADKIIADLQGIENYRNTPRFNNKVRNLEDSIYKFALAFNSFQKETMENDCCLVCGSKDKVKFVDQVLRVKNVFVCDRCSKLSNFRDLVGFSFNFIDVKTLISNPTVSMVKQLLFKFNQESAKNSTLGIPKLVDFAEAISQGVGLSISEVSWRNFIYRGMKPSPEIKAGIRYLADEFSVKITGVEEVKLMPRGNVLEILNELYPSEKEVFHDITKSSANNNFLYSNNNYLELTNEQANQLLIFLFCIGLEDLWETTIQKLLAEDLELVEP